MELFPYQRDGVLFLENRKGRGLLADEMGLGKTVQVCGWLKHRKSCRPVIVVCPTSVRLHWQHLINQILDEECYLPVSQTPTGEGFTNQTFVIIHYSILPHWVSWIKRLRPQVLVVDECQAIKSNKAQRTRAVKSIARRVPHVIGLSGTPIINRPVEAYNILNLIDRNAIPGWREYTNRYCKAHLGRWGWDYSGASHTEELYQILTKSDNPVMLRRRKIDVLPMLPAKIRSFVPLQLDNYDEYQEAEEDFIGYLTGAEGIEAAKKANKAFALTRISKLRLLAARGKLTQAIEWITDTIEQEKLVVFAVHHEILDPLFSKFGKIAVGVDGNVSERARDKAIERFQTDPKCRLFIGQIQAAGTGITLTAASRVAFLEIPWTPGEILQCEDRVHRIGQIDAVWIYYLLAARTIDEYMASLIDSKRGVLDAVLDGSANASDSIVVELINLYKRRGLANVNKPSDRHVNRNQVGNQVFIQDRNRF